MILIDDFTSNIGVDVDSSKYPQISCLLLLSDDVTTISPG